ncbi:MAG: ArsR/SmtB family transcription factor [Myxococcota bacterium]
MDDSEVFRALAHPTRRAVLTLLADGEKTVSQLHAGFDISQPAMSQHLAALRAAGLVAERREGRNAYYRAEPAGMAPLMQFVEQYLEQHVERYREHWPKQLTRLKGVLARMDQ